MTISTVSFQSINVGTSANDGTGDDLRTSFQKVNANFGWIGNTGFAAANISVTNEIDAVTANISGEASVRGNLTRAGGTIDTGYQYYSPSGNLAFTANTNISRVILDPSSYISLWANITLPAGNVDGKTITVSSTQTVQFLYVQPNTGTTLVNQGNLTLGAGNSFTYFFHGVESKWYKIG